MSRSAREPVHAVHTARPPLHAALRRFGIGPLVLASTVVSVAASVVIVTLLHRMVFHTTMRPAAWTATLLAPLLIAPSMSALMLRLAQQLAQLQDRLEAVIHVDDLTGLNNRRYFMQALQGEVERARRSGSRFALAIVDVDDFKTVNDRYGHPAGDEVLRQIARACCEAVRETDVVARIGGEEFAFLFPDSSLESAAELSTRLLARIRALRPQLGQPPLSLSVSVGLTALGGAASDLERALRLADQALYAAKAAGKDRIESMVMA